MVPRKLLTVAEAAESLGIRPATLRQQILNNRKTGGRIGLRARKLGRDWRIDPDDVERYRMVSRGQPGRRTKKARPPSPG